MVTHEGVEHDFYHPLMVIDGLVVELGEFLQVEGEVATAADTTGFSMNVLSGDAAITDTLLDVMLQQNGINFNGTRIVSKSGELMDFSAILPGLPVQVGGTLEAIPSPQLLRAALVIVDTDALDVKRVTGKIVTVNDSSSLELDPDATTVCGVSYDTPDETLKVYLAQNLQIMTVTITETSSSIVPGGTLVAEKSVGMTGVCQFDGFYTGNLVIVDEQRTLP